MEGIFTFDDILDIDDKKLKEIIWKIDTKELSKALISESAELRKKIYHNMSLENLKILNKDMMDTERFTVYEKRNAQRRLLKLIANMPEHKEKRFENGFESLREFEDYLLLRKPNDGNYGIFDKDVTMCRMDSIKNSEEILADIEQKNEEEKMGNFKIPSTKIKLINFSLCPICKKVFSFKDLSNYYANPKIDTRYKNIKEQYRQDTRVYCNDCGTYFLPALIISDGTPQSEIQFLCRIQTMHAIEDYYDKKGVGVLSKNKRNILKKEIITTTTTQTNSKNIINKIFSEDRSSKTNIITAIRNDVFIKDMEEKSTLITNLLQYTPVNLVMNIIDGSNFREKDVLFGVWG
jgi:hypothetical protein